jgi:hypothetical protein
MDLRQRVTRLWERLRPEPRKTGTRCTRDEARAAAENDPSVVHIIRTPLPMPSGMTHVVIREVTEP